MNVKTIQLQGNDYAKVVERLKLFKEENPNSKQESDYVDENGVVVFKTWLWKDKNELLDLMKAGVTDKEVLRSSSDSNGTAKGEPKDKKGFEKLETISLGRALANLGYLASGEIASTEEMEEFLDYQKTKKEEELENLKAQVDQIKTIEELREFYKANKGKGEDFDNYITEKSKELKNDNS